MQGGYGSHDGPATVSRSFLFSDSRPWEDLQWRIRGPTYAYTSAATATCGGGALRSTFRRAGGPLGRRVGEALACFMHPTRAYPPPSTVSLLLSHHPVIIPPRFLSFSHPRLPPSHHIHPLRRPPISTSISSANTRLHSTTSETTSATAQLGFLAPPLFPTTLSPPSHRLGSPR